MRLTVFWYLKDFFLMIFICSDILYVTFCYYIMKYVNIWKVYITQHPNVFKMTCLWYYKMMPGKDSSKCKTDQWTFFFSPSLGNDRFFFFFQSLLASFHCHSFIWMESCLVIFLLNSKYCEFSLAKYWVLYFYKPSWLFFWDAVITWNQLDPFGSCF